MAIFPTDGNVETFAGATRVKPIQVGFPVELTGVWDASTGYPWKRLMLDGVAVADASPIQMTGTNAVAIDGNEDLTSGTVGWLEPDPSAVGWLFISGTTVDGLTVEDSTDSNPSYTGITKLQFDLVDGFALTNPSTGVARIGLTAPVVTQGNSGITPAEDRMAVFLDENIVGPSTALYVNRADLGGGDPAKGVLSLAPAGTSTNTSLPGYEVEVQLAGDVDLFHRLGIATLSIGLGAPLATTNILASSLSTNTVTGESFEWVIASTGSSILPTGAGSVQFHGAYTADGISTSYESVTVAAGAFAICNAGGITSSGYTGTPGPGFTTSGGLVITGGSGSFVGTASSNAFTNTNSFAAATTFTGTVASQNAATFTPASAATVPTTIQGAASQSADLLQLKNSGGTLLGGFDANGVGEFSMDFGTF